MKKITIAKLTTAVMTVTLWDKEAGYIQSISYDASNMVDSKITEAQMQDASGVAERVKPFEVFDVRFEDDTLVSDYMVAGPTGVFVMIDGRQYQDISVVRGTMKESLKLNVVEGDLHTALLDVFAELDKDKRDDVVNTLRFLDEEIRETYSEIEKAQIANGHWQLLVKAA